MISIFGGGGFIGIHLSDYLINEDYNVTAIDIDSEKISENCLKSKKFTFISLDVQKDDKPIKEIVKNSDIVINLIAYAVPELYLKKPLEVVSIHGYFPEAVAGIRHPYPVL